MEASESDELMAAAVAVSHHASAPYSNIQVGAALRTADGETVCGANVESASYGLTCCAERVALFAALSQGHREFIEMGLVSSVTPHLLPCGACRQLLAEYAPGLRIRCANRDNPASADELLIEELLPNALTRLPGD